MAKNRMGHSNPCAYTKMYCGKTCAWRVFCEAWFLHLTAESGTLTTPDPDLKIVSLPGTTGCSIPPEIFWLFRQGVLNYMLFFRLVNYFLLKK
jgi:hypothetical protein